MNAQPTETAKPSGSRPAEVGTMRAMKRELEPLNARWDALWKRIEAAHAAGDADTFERLNDDRRVMQHEMCEISRKHYGIRS